MKLEAGKKYKDRNGDVLTIATQSNAAYPFRGTGYDGSSRTFDENGSYWGAGSQSNLDLVEEVKETPKTTPHVHRDLMIQYANDTSLVIQYRLRGTDDEWKTIRTQPGWGEDIEYRIKPKEVELTVYGFAQRLPEDQVTVKSFDVTKGVVNNLKLTFSPEGALVKAEVL